MTSGGRAYYVDHNTRTTQWNAPSSMTPPLRWRWLRRLGVSSSGAARILQRMAACGIVLLSVVFHLLGLVLFVAYMEPTQPDRRWWPPLLASGALANALFLRTWLGDAGAMAQQASVRKQDKATGKKWCARCCIVQPLRTLHCPVCDRCIKQMYVR